MAYDPQVVRAARARLERRRTDATTRAVTLHEELTTRYPRLAAIEPAQRAALPGITQDRAMTIVGAGIIAVEIMRALGINEIEVCPWALREGAILRWLDQYGRTRFGF